MLASILPGIRDLRVPLSAGIIWLVSLWLALTPFLPTTLPPVIGQVADVGGFLNGAVLLTVFVFVAYLLGIVVEPVSLRRFYRVDPVEGVSRTSYMNLKERVERELKNAKGRGIAFSDLVAQFPELDEDDRRRMSDDERWEAAEIARSEEGNDNTPLGDVVESEQWAWLNGHVDQIVEQAVSELRLAEVSLQASSRDVYDSYDRTKAEAEFRHAIAVPLAALLGVVGVRLGVGLLGAFAAGFALLLLPVLLLERSARRQDEKAADLIVQAILVGKADSPTLNLISDLSPRNNRTGQGPHVGAGSPGR